LQHHLVKLHVIKLWRDFKMCQNLTTWVKNKYNRIYSVIQWLELRWLIIQAELLFWTWQSSGMLCRVVS
jgi:hypothetical protein